MTPHDIAAAARGLYNEADEIEDTACAATDKEADADVRENALAEMQDPRWLTEIFRRFLALRRVHRDYLRQQGIEIPAPIPDPAEGP